MTKQFVVGESSKSPQDGQSKFVSDFLGECFVNFIMIDNQVYNQLHPNPQFIHSYLQNTVDIFPLTFSVSSKIVFDITPVKPSFV